MKQPLRVEDLNVMGVTRYEDVAVNKVFTSFLKPFAVCHYSLTALNMSSRIPQHVKVLVKQDVRGRRLKRKPVKISKRHGARKVLGFLNDHRKAYIAV